MRVAAMPKKRGRPAKSESDPDPLDQISIRFKRSVLARLEVAADPLGLDVSNLVRLIVSQKLPEYEQMAQAAKPLE